MGGFKQALCGFGHTLSGFPIYCDVENVIKITKFKYLLEFFLHSNNSDSNDILRKNIFQLIQRIHLIRRI